MSLRVMIAVTHLLGAGHLTRAAALARAFAAAGHETTLVSGGSSPPPPGLGRIAFIQLPPVRIAGADFKTLLNEAGDPIDEARLAERRAILLQALKVAKPDILITELFPFGRRILAQEFTALIEEAQHLGPRPLLLCSIRDILAVPSKAERIEEAHKRILDGYDAVLVHGDPRLIPLEASWPVGERIRPLIHYTGYVDENPTPLPDQERHGIVVSGGSSAASLPLYRAAVAGARDIADRPWRILIGRAVTEADFRALQEGAPDHVAVERASPDFRTLLSRAELSVSQAGYNTVVDLLRSRVRSVLVPFEAGHETEQRLRAERLKTLGLAEVVLERDLSPKHLGEAVLRVLSRETSSPLRLDLDGARRSVVIAESLVVSGPALHRRIDWTPLGRALDRAQDRGCPIRFWWRDDDAAKHTPQLDRLLEIARTYEAGIGLAVIPAHLDSSLAERLNGEEAAFALVHGSSHTNHAPSGEKKAEFGSHRSVGSMAEEAEQALQAASKLLSPRLLPIFVPPWNRIAPPLMPLLPELGFTALSTFADRTAACPAPGLLQINTHVDPIDWRGTRGAAEPTAIVASLTRAVENRIDGSADPDEPVGFLTHHLVHDENIWSICEQAISYLAGRNIRFMRIEKLFRHKRHFKVEA